MKQPESVYQFTAMTSSDQLRYIHVDAVPRSMSTVLPIALRQAGIIDPTRQYKQFDEPLNWQTRAIGFSAVAESILPLCKADMPTTIIEKSTARNVYPATFEDIGRLASGVVFTVRHPYKQMGSLAQRIANDLIHGKGADKITLSELPDDEYRAAMQAVDEFLVVSGHHDGTWPRGEVPYMQPSWREIGVNFKHAVETGIPTAIIDGSRLAEQPELTLRRLCSILPIPYTPEMVEGWSNSEPLNKAYTNWPKGRFNGNGQSNAWVTRATQSKGIEPESPAVFDIKRCPPRMRKYIDEVALPVYVEMIAHPNSNIESKTSA